MVAMDCRRQVSDCLDDRSSSGVRSTGDEVCRARDQRRESGGCGAEAESEESGSVTVLPAFREDEAGDERLINDDNVCDSAGTKTSDLRYTQQSRGHSRGGRDSPLEVRTGIDEVAHAVD